MRILLIPDAYVGDASGAVVAQVLVQNMTELGHCVAVFSSDCKEGEVGAVRTYNAPVTCANANYFSAAKFKDAFKHVVSSFDPTNIFFVGSITNKPLVYLEEALRRKLHIDVFIFMQDFFCAKFYANDSNAPCTKCLDLGLHHSLFSSCGARDTLSKMQLLVRYDIRRRLKKLLPQVNHVITSTDEQCSFYERFGIDKKHIAKVPLPFSSNKLDGIKPSRGKYVIGIAQNRIEKGFHLITNILPYLSKEIPVVLAYSNQEKANMAIHDWHLLEFIDNGQLQVVVKSWKDGLGELIANSLGVINTSIWPTTTEYGLQETLALSKPVIAFDISAHHELLKQGENGFVSPLGDYKAFAENIEALAYLSDEAYERVSAASRALFYSQWNYELLKQNLIDIL